MKAIVFAVQRGERERMRNRLFARFIFFNIGMRNARTLLTAWLLIQIVRMAKHIVLGVLVLPLLALRING